MAIQRLFGRSFSKYLDEEKAAIISHGHDEVTYNIPRRTLLNKLKIPHQLKHGGQLAFNTEEENSLVVCFIKLGNYDFSVIKADLSTIISFYIQGIGRKVDKFRITIYQGETGLKVFWNETRNSPQDL